MTHTRRTVLAGASAFAATGLFAPFVRGASAQSGPLRVGVLLPYSGTYAQLGEAITRAMELYVKQNGDALAGRKITFVKVDDESEPTKATDLTNKLVLGEKVDVLVGTVHSGVAMAMAKIAKETGVPTLIPNAGANQITRAGCARNIFRTSFGNSQVGEATGRAMAKAGIKTVVSFTWRYAAGEESVAGFKAGFQDAGGTVLKDIALPFPDVEFQSALSEIAALKPQAVYSFFAGGGAVKFIKDFGAAKLNESIQLWGPGFLTDGVEQAVGPAGNGIKTALHYVDGLDNPENKAFRKLFADAYKSEADVYAVQGWDTMQVLALGLKAVNGDVAKRKEMFEAMSAAAIASPRGPFKFGPSNNPIHNFYLRELQNGVNVYKGLAAEMLSDSSAGCRMA